MDKLRALQTFVAIVDQGSLTKAAAALGSSLPAVVRLLAALEQSLGARLLQRTTRRLSLTEEGRDYLERARRVLADLDEADRLVAREQAEPAGALTVTAPVLFGQRHVEPAVVGFLQRHPRVRVNLLLLDRVSNLVEEGIDAAVRIGPLHDSTLVARPLGSVRRIVVASPACLRRHGVPAHPRELARRPCLRSSAGDAHAWQFREPGGRLLSVPVQGPLESNLLGPLLQAGEAGLGFVRCLSYQVTAALKARRLRIVLAEYETEPWPVSLAYPSARLLPSRTRAFIDEMAAALRQGLQEGGPETAKARS